MTTKIICKLHVIYFSVRFLIQIAHIRQLKAIYLFNSHGRGGGSHSGENEALLCDGFRTFAMETQSVWKHALRPFSTGNYMYNTGCKTAVDKKMMILMLSWFNFNAKVMTKCGWL